MCSGRVDMSFVLRAFSNGTDGVFIGGCHLNECHYITDGNHHAASMVQLCKKLLACIGVNSKRIRMESLSAGEGIRFAEVMNEFSRDLRALGPLGKSEELDGKDLNFRLEAAAKLVPYIRLVERERLRVRFNSVEEYEKYFNSDEVNCLFKELIGDKLVISEIMALLKEKPRSTGEISEALGVAPSEISKHLMNAAKQGLTGFDESRKRYTRVSGRI
jgi:F420-non-reducing hydrogenase iron-sulfur subunit